MVSMVFKLVLQRDPAVPPPMPTRSRCVRDPWRTTHRHLLSPPMPPRSGIGYAPEHGVDEALEIEPSLSVAADDGGSLSVRRHHLPVGAPPVSRRRDLRASQSKALGIIQAAAGVNIATAICCQRESMRTPRCCRRSGGVLTGRPDRTICPSLGRSPGYRLLPQIVARGSGSVCDSRRQPW